MLLPLLSLLAALPPAVHPPSALEHLHPPALALHLPPHQLVEPPLRLLLLLLQ